MSYLVLVVGKDHIEIRYPGAMTNIIEDATMELWAIINAEMNHNPLVTSNKKKDYSFHCNPLI